MHTLVPLLLIAAILAFLGMTTFGRQVLASTGLGIKVSADGQPVRPIAGVTVDWATVAAVGADTTIDQGFLIRNGQKFLRYGQILCQIGTNVVQTITVDATGGTFTISLTRPDNGQVVTTAPIAEGATAAAVLAAVQAVIPPTDIVSVAGSAGGPFTFTFNKPYIAMTTDPTLLTGAGNTAVVAVTTAALASAGKVGPYDPNATDGRQTLARGNCWILNQTMPEILPAGIGSVASDHPDVIEGGLVWFDRLIITRGAHTLAAGPTVAEFETVFPRVGYVQSP